MTYCTRFLLAATVVCLATESWAANSVVVESKQVAGGATGVTVGAFVTNDVSLTAIDLILEVREVTPGSFTMNTFTLTIQGRVAASGLMDIPAMRYFGTPVTNTCSGPVSNSYGTTSPVDFISPDALEWVGLQIMGPMLAPGTDGSPGSGTPSFLLTFDVTLIDGLFEIDTCCTTPSNHLLFLDDSHNSVVPSFQKGTVAIGSQPNNPPVAVCSPLVTATDAGTCERASVNPADLDGGSFDPDGDAITFSVIPAGPYPLGVIPVLLVVEDVYGDKDTCQTSVTVVDEESPVVTCPSDKHVGADPGRCDAIVSFSLPAAVDNCGVGAVTADPPSGWLFPVGETAVRVIATDDSGNADTCYFDVVVEDRERPLAVCPDDTTVEAARGETGAFVSFILDAVDNCPGVFTVANPPSGSFFPIGTTPVEIIAYDLEWTPDTCYFSVTVVELGPGNVVEVESKVVTAGASGVQVGIYITNDISLAAISLPFEFRSVTPGCFMRSSLTITPQGRVAASGLMDLWNEQRYPAPAVTNVCSGPVSSYYSVPGLLDFISPDALHWTGVRLVGPYLGPGTDAVPGLGTPSFVLTFDVNWVGGSFEIDTCCVAPDNHLTFFDPTPTPYAPLFTKGVITVDAGSVCNDRPADVNCDGVVDVIDVVRVVNTAFRSVPEPSRCCAGGP